jgi:hypothetical protein
LIILPSGPFPLYFCFFLIAERRTAAGRTPLFSSHVFPRQRRRRRRRNRRRRRRRSVFGEDFRFNNESCERQNEEDLFFRA